MKQAADSNLSHLTLLLDLSPLGSSWWCCCDCCYPPTFVLIAAGLPSLVLLLCLRLSLPPPLSPDLTPPPISPRPARSIFQPFANFLEFPALLWCPLSSLACFAVSLSSALVPRFSLTLDRRHRRARSYRHRRYRSDGVTLLTSTSLPPSDPNFSKFAPLDSFRAATLNPSAAAPLSSLSLTLAYHHLPLLPITTIVTTTIVDTPTTTVLATTFPRCHHRRRHRHCTLFLTTFLPTQQDGSYQADSPKVYRW